jgi:putative ABC transport system ATP-binding protein
LGPPSALLAGASLRRSRDRGQQLLLEQVGLTDRAGHGQLDCAGAANEPLILLADEPPGNLDSAATTDVLRLFDPLHADGRGS